MLKNKLLSEVFTQPS